MALRSSAQTLFVADDIITYDDRGLTVAKGHVEISLPTMNLWADTLTYNRHTDVMEASGHVVLTSDGKTTLFATYATFSQSTKKATLKALRVRENNLTITARKGTSSPTKRTYWKVSYTACTLQRHNVPPAFWFLRASHMVHNLTTHQFILSHTQLRLQGVPVFYSPYLSFYDNTVKRASGFLTPVYGGNTYTGSFAQVPYFQILGSNVDTTFFPTWTMKKGLIPALELRFGFRRGRMLFFGSRFNDEDKVSHISSSRWFYAAIGGFDLTDHWRMTYHVQNESDPSYVYKYGSLWGYGAPDKTLNSQGHLEYFASRTYGSFDMYAFQHILRTEVPIFVPSLTYHTETRSDTWGGYWKGDLYGMTYSQEKSLSRRELAFLGSYTLPFLFTNGVVGKARLSLRAGLLQEEKLVLPPSNVPSQLEGSRGQKKILPRLSLEASYPLRRRVQDSTTTLIPKVGLYMSPTHFIQQNLGTNLDTPSFSFSASSVFSESYSPGFDVFETGQRLSYGLQVQHHTTVASTPLSIDALFAQNVRFTSPTPMERDIGVRKGLSDYLMDFKAGLSFFTLDDSLALDRKDLTTVRHSLSARLSFPYVSLGESYLYFKGTKTIPEVNTLTSSLSTTLIPSWTLSVFQTDLLGDPGTVQARAATITYQNDCFLFSALLKRTYNLSKLVKPSTSLMFTVSFNTLGATSLNASSLFTQTGRP